MSDETFKRLKDITRLDFFGGGWKKPRQYHLSVVTWVYGVLLYEDLAYYLVVTWVHPTALPKDSYLVKDAHAALV